jgi:hypothetical protein
MCPPVFRTKGKAFVAPNREDVKDRSVKFLLFVQSLVKAIMQIWRNPEIFHMVFISIQVHVFALENKATCHDSPASVKISLNGRK